MKKTIFVVKALSGEYSARTEWTVCAFDDEETAERMISSIEDLYLFNNHFHERLKKEFEEPNHVEDPRNIVPSTNLGVKEYHAAFNEAYQEYLRKCYEFEKLRRQWIQDNYVVPEELRDAAEYVPYDGYCDPGSILYDYEETTLFETYTVEEKY